MQREVDYDYEFEFESEDGLPLLPEKMTRDGGLYVLPNGKLLPPGAYATSDGGGLIYEPQALGSWASRLAQCTEE